MEDNDDTLPVRIDKDAVEKLREYCRKHGKIQKFVASKAIRQYLDKKEESEKS